MGRDNAAFFDILAPPYHVGGDADQEDEIRQCHFFSEISSSNNLVWLGRTKPPDDYFCDTEPYKGPRIHSE